MDYAAERSQDGKASSAGMRLLGRERFIGRERFSGDRG
jgi:hypothetical protein